LSRAGGIAVDNIRGRLKFHSLRHTTGTFLIAQGANIKIVQEVMRHKSIELTLSRYGHLLKGQKKSAIAGLGKLSVRQAATGTD
jgi:integrase